MTANGHPWDEPTVRALRADLLAFFDGRRRELPWRDTSDPYLVLVSEVMLQQTRVETAVPYYLRWLERFPDAETLAAAGREDVLRAWQGLGYYSRARNLHRAAREIVETHGGRVPADVATLLNLPGVGPYTAGAVASIAFGAPVPAVDGNVRRVLSRLTDTPSPTPRELARWAGALVDGKRPGDFNQALMELGSLVCTAGRPECAGCPVAAFCAARSAGTVSERPSPRRPSPVPRLVQAVAVLTRMDGGRARVLLRRRPEEGLLGGMWECPGSEVTGGACPDAIARALAGSLAPGATPLPAPTPLDPVDHAFSHLRVRYLPRLFRLGGPRSNAVLPDATRWVGFSGLGEVPLPVAQGRILDGARNALG